MLVCAISDLHGYLPKIPECDTLLIAGDICPHDDRNHQLKWMDEKLRPWLLDIEVPVFACAGNHDWPMEKMPDKVRALDLPWTYLQDAGVNFDGVKIWGTPWCPHYHDWAFMLNENQLTGKWNMIPDDVDIIISHGPPKFYGDKVIRGTHEGSESLTNRIQQIKPKLVVFGHIHEGRGEWNYSGTHLANVTLMNKMCKYVYDPWVYELPD